MKWDYGLKKCEALHLRHLKIAECLNVGTCPLPLKFGDHVQIQNQILANGTEPVIEVKQFDQYGIKVDGSGRVTLRNRKFEALYN